MIVMMMTMMMIIIKMLVLMNAGSELATCVLGIGTGPVNS